MRPLALVVLLTTSGGLTTAAQDPRLDRLDSATHAAVVALIDSARAAGLPAEPLVDRALEGATKRAPGELIVAAVRRLARQLGRARQVLGPGASTPELEAGAAALRAGADSAVLATLRQSRPRRPLTVPLALLADLVASGVPADTAATAVLALAGVEDEDLIQFRRSVEHDIALGVLPGTAAWIWVGSPEGLTADGARNTGTGRPPAPRRP
jgi:hypothetical protein